MYSVTPLSHVHLSYFPPCGNVKESNPCPSRGINLTFQNNTLDFSFLPSFQLLHSPTHSLLLYTNSTTFYPPSSSFHLLHHSTIYSFYHVLPSNLSFLRFILFLRKFFPSCFFLFLRVLLIVFLIFMSSLKSFELKAMLYRLYLYLIELTFNWKLKNNYVLSKSKI